MAQEVTTGPLLVSLRGGATLHFSGGRELLAIVWDALDGVAEQAETAEDGASTGISTSSIFQETSTGHRTRCHWQS